MTIEELARISRRHRNTVANVESGRPVKFKTIVELMVRMGYGAASGEMKSVALLWLEAVSGLPFSQPETSASAQKSIAGYRSATRQVARQLDQAVQRAGLSLEEIRLLIFAVEQPEALAILKSVRNLAADLAAPISLRPEEQAAAEPPAPSPPPPRKRGPARSLRRAGPPAVPPA